MPVSRWIAAGRAAPTPSQRSDLLDGVQYGDQVGVENATGATLEHAFEYENVRLRKHGAQLGSLLCGGHEEMTAAFDPQPPRDGRCTQTVGIGLDHGPASRLRRRFAQGAVVSRQRIQIDCQDTRRQQIRVGGHKI